MNALVFARRGPTRCDPQCRDEDRAIAAMGGTVASATSRTRISEADANRTLGADVLGQSGTEQAADHERHAIGIARFPPQRRVAEHELEELGEQEERSRNEKFAVAAAAFATEKRGLRSTSAPAWGAPQRTPRARATEQP